MTDYETILVETRGRVGWITVNRPGALNALKSQVMHDIADASTRFDEDEAIGAIVVTGSERAFAAGADIKEMESKTALEMVMGDHFGGWARFAGVRTPTIAAVSGYALGGGCELALMCDIILAADTATFGQPEINLGVIPGMGGTQRLVRAIGYYKAAELVLTGRPMKAAEAERAGLVSRVVPAEDLLAEAGKTADAIASKSLPSLYAAKAALDAALETTLAEGMRFEKQVFSGLFGTEDQKEGMAAFREKRAPNFTNR
ncbi:enoyl-CoA hydratase-related protein [Micromonospora sp. DT81.3]|uniref:enoyl-CoA hydratase-related protein n=1 Tax=Micromonospora sp. DT81.3 TaxID=3416523 RepID=UPI003CEA2FE6